MRATSLENALRIIQTRLHFPRIPAGRNRNTSADLSALVLRHLSSAVHMQYPYSTQEAQMERKYTRGYAVKHRNKWRAIVNWQDDNGKQHRLTKSTGITCHPDKVDPSTGKTVPDKGNSRRSMYCQNTGDLKKTCQCTDVLGCSRQVIEIGPFETRHVLPNAGDPERYRKNGAPAQADVLLRKPIAATTLSSRTGGSNDGT